VEEDVPEFGVESLTPEFFCVSLVAGEII